MKKARRRNRFRLALYKIIFQTDTRAGKIFDEVLLIVIILSVALVMLDSVQSIHKQYGDILYCMELGYHNCFFTGILSSHLGVRASDKVYI
ncbi:MAG: hypothetical protein PF489_10005 [Salinivirgaceae bacterium]|jgi:voltage-gated potassium channel|nr:hypothetical protein [Salinivirgaceae bacterium]